MSPKREQILDAAIELLGNRGSRGLTHRGVDAIADLPAGTTSNYFRTREALLGGVVDRLVARDRTDWAALATAPIPQTVDEVLGGAVAFVLHSTGPDRVRSLARYALLIEAASSPEISGPLRAARSALVSWAEQLMSVVCPTDTQRITALLLDQAEALILHQLAMPVDEFDPRPTLAHLLALVQAR